MLPGTQVWLSSEDIAKGTLWFSKIIDKLKECSCGVICITRENLLAPWIHFEAGGLIAGLGKNRVVTLLLDVGFGEVQPPLNQFNGSLPDRLGLFDLVKSFNNVSDRPIPAHVLQKTFDKFWSEMEADIRRLFPPVKDVSADPEPTPPVAPFVPGPVAVDAIKKKAGGKGAGAKKTKRASGDDMQPLLFSNGEK